MEQKAHDKISAPLKGKVGCQEIPGVTGKFGLGVQNEARQRLTEFSQENSLVIANTFFQQHKRRHYTWTSPDGQYRNQIDYILCSRRWRSSTQSAKTRPGADCDSDHELLIAKFRPKLKKVGETTRFLSLGPRLQAQGLRCGSGEQSCLMPVRLLAPHPVVRSFLGGLDTPSPQIG